MVQEVLARGDDVCEWEIGLRMGGGGGILAVWPNSHGQSCGMALGW